MPRNVAVVTSTLSSCNVLIVVTLGLRNFTHALLWLHVSTLLQHKQLVSCCTWLLCGVQNPKFPRKKKTFALVIRHNAHVSSARGPQPGKAPLMTSHCRKWAVWIRVTLTLVRERTIPTERPPLVGEASANFFADQNNGSSLPYTRISRPEPLLLNCTHEAVCTLFQTPILFRKSGSTGNRTWTSGSVARNSDHYITEATGYFNPKPLKITVVEQAVIDDALSGEDVSTNVVCAAQPCEHWKWESPYVWCSIDGLRF
jgi:hypothetical protein